MVTAGFGLYGAQVAAQNVAMVTDVSGKITGPIAISILSEIPANTRLQLKAGARLVAIYLESGDEYTFSGPSQIVFKVGKPSVLRGVKVSKRASPLGTGRDATINPASVAQAAFVTRGARIKLLTLSDTKTFESSPEFRWHGSEPNTQYRFELTDDTAQSLYESETQATSLRLPASVVLREGASYSWQVSTGASEDQRDVGTGEFSIAHADVRARAAMLRPLAAASVSQRVAYAAWLEQMELRDEARSYWRVLSDELPEEAKLRALATR